MNDPISKATEYPKFFIYPKKRHSLTQETSITYSVNSVKEEDEEIDKNSNLFKHIPMPNDRNEFLSHLNKSADYKKTHLKKNKENSPLYKCYSSGDLNLQKINEAINIEEEERKEKKSRFKHLISNVDKIEDYDNLPSSKRINNLYSESGDSPIREDNEEYFKDEEKKKHTPKLTPKNSFLIKKCDEIDSLDSKLKIERRIEEILNEIIVEENEEIETNNVVFDKVKNKMNEEREFIRKIISGDEQKLKEIIKKEYNNIRNQHSIEEMHEEYL